MFKKTVLRLAIFGLLFAAGSGVFAQVTVSGGFALSSIDRVNVTGGGSPNIDSEIGFGGNIYADYLLPVSVPVSLGLEVGLDTAKFTLKESGESYKETVTAVPLLVRAAYHFDLLPRLDLYVVGKIGYTFGSWSGDYRDYADDAGFTIDPLGGVAFGFDVGVAYYFSPTIGIFGEAGFDNYALEGKIKSDYGSSTLEAPFSRFLTIGISFKFDTSSSSGGSSEE